MSTVYLDASAIVKLVVPEPGSVELERRIGGSRLVTSAISRVEVTRAVRRRSASSTRAPADVLVRVASLAMDEAVLSLAAALSPPALRTLDAIHLASALQMGGDLEAFVTYDRQLGEAAVAAGLSVETPR